MTDLQRQLRDILRKDKRIIGKIAFEVGKTPQTILRWSTTAAKRFSPNDEEKLRQVLDGLNNGK